MWMSPISLCFRGNLILGAISTKKGQEGVCIFIGNVNRCGRTNRYERQKQ